MSLALASMLALSAETTTRGGGDTLENLNAQPSNTSIEQISQSSKKPIFLLMEVLNLAINTTLTKKPWGFKKRLESIQVSI